MTAIRTVSPGREDVAGVMTGKHQSAGGNDLAGLVVPAMGDGRRRGFDRRRQSLDLFYDGVVVSWRRVSSIK